MYVTQKLAGFSRREIENETHKVDLQKVMGNIPYHIYDKTYTQMPPYLISTLLWVLLMSNKTLLRFPN